MKVNNILIIFSNLILIFSFIYLGLEIYTLIFNLKFWIKSAPLIEIFFGLFREICEILYIPLWGIVLSFAFIFCNYWIINKNENNM